MRFILLALALTMSAPVFAACIVPGLPAITWNNYHEARAKLLKAGADPVLDRADYSGPAGELAALGYYEVQGCAPTGVAPCRFAWSHNGKRFFVITESLKVKRLLCS